MLHAHTRAHSAISCRIQKCLVFLGNLTKLNFRKQIVVVLSRLMSNIYES